MEALQLFVRNFKSVTKGKKIIADLENLGFEISVCSDAGNDSGGGLIETKIASVNRLETESIEEIKEEIGLTDPAYIEYTEFDISDEGRCP